MARTPFLFAARAPGAPKSASQMGTTICAPLPITSRAAVADRLRSDLASTWMILIGRPFTPPAALMSSAASCMPALIAVSNGASTPVRLLAVPITIGLPVGFDQLAVVVERMDDSPLLPPQTASIATAAVAHR